MKKITILICGVIICKLTFTQTRIHQTGTNNNVWITYNGDHKINEKWGLHVDGHIRRNDFLSKPQQLLFRPGINYHLNNSISFSAGYTYAYTYAYGIFPSPAAFPENRFWEQVQVKIPLQKIEWISRLRLEQRLVKTPIKNTQGVYEPGDAVYTNRYRLMNRLSIPLKGKTISPGSTYFTVMDEIMINSGKNIGLNIFDQNRAYLAIGYFFAKLGKMELGYMMQSIVRADGIRIEKNNTIQLTLNSTAPFHKKK
ncbi:MAG: DUF2490 domain-containing protein [Chitinophagaceae bacterium]|jgi:Protein of unknown function (DUF2490)